MLLFNIHCFMKNIKLILLNILLFLFSTYSLAQPPPPPGFNALEKTQDQKIDSLINFYTEKNKLQYLAVLPSFNYNFLDNTFNLGISFSNLSSFYQNKHRNKIELQKLKFQLIERKERNISALEKEYELLMDSYDILKLESENFNLTREIFHLKEAQYENNRIDLEAWLNVQKNYQDKKLSLLVKSKSLITKMKQFEIKIKDSCFSEEIEFLKSNSFED